MNRSHLPSANPIFVETLEQRIAPASLLNDNKFTSVPVGGTVLLDASDPNGFQGITTGTGPGSGSYLLYITAGKALVYTSDLNGDHILQSNEITGISAGVDSNGKAMDLIAFTDIHGDIVTNLLPGRGVSALTDSDNNPSNGRDGRVLLPNGIHSITLRTLQDGDIDTTLNGGNNTVFNRLALTTYSIYGNVYMGGDFGGTDGGGLVINTSGSPQLALKFNGAIPSTQLYLGNDHPKIEGIYTGTAANYQHFNLTYGIGTADPNTGLINDTNVRGEFVPFVPAAGQHGGDIFGVTASSTATLFDIGVLDTGNGGQGARGGNISGVVLHGDRGGYQIITGDGGTGATGGDGGSLIGFNDLGTVTSKIVIHTGAGGIGTLGSGGTGGVATFATTALAANVQIFLGNGGDGFNKGGNGDGLSNAIFNVPEGVVPNGSNFIGTYHAPGDIGNTQYLGNGVYVPRVIDFDGDGYGDAVITTIGPDQIEIIFGNGAAGFSDNNGLALAGPSKTIFLDVPGVIGKSISISDVNGDGKIDVVAASTSLDGAGGLYVFLNQIGDNVHNPIGNGTYQRNPLGDHPFSSPFITPIPDLSSFFFGAVFDTVNPILAVTTGDFNNDGHVDVGYTVQNTERFTQKKVVEVEIAFGQGNGYFYYNTQADTTQPAILAVGPEIAGDGNLQNLRASALVATAPGTTPAFGDSLFYAPSGSKFIDIYQTDPSLGLILTQSVSAGSVDTNRVLLGPNTSLQGVSAINGYDIADHNGDGIADLAILTKTPGDFVVTIQGTAGGFGGAAFTNITSGIGANAGILVNDAGQVGTTTLDIRSIDFNGDGRFDNVALLDFYTVGGIHVHVNEFNIPQTPITFSAGDNFGGNDVAQNIVSIANILILAPSSDIQIRAFDTYYNNTPAFLAGTKQQPGYGLLDPNLADYRYAFIEVYNPLGLVSTGFALFNVAPIYETDNGIRIFAGSGGNSTTGAGGLGGTLGDTLTTTSGGAAAGSLQIVFPAYPAYFGEADLVAGNGGSGFGAGGNGGEVRGVATRYNPNATLLDATVSLVGGNGGNGVIGNGGNGGTLSQFSLDSGRDLLAGNAGNGVNGGTGGNIIGNGSGGALFDVRANSYVTAIAGIGGLGSLLGGTGGRIDTFQPLFLSTGPLSLISGNGGSAAAGQGGSGGAVVNSSPNSSENQLQDGLLIITGNGGNGLQGGDGGGLTNFINQATSPTAVPADLNIVTGSGGIGVSAAGGVGGVINNFNANGTGLGVTTGFSPIFQTPQVRVLAGNGGASFGDQGGKGGSITNSTAIATGAPIVFAAGAGGAGLTFGGAGGAIDNDVVNSSALNIGKVLVVAGEGGDASAALATDIAISGDSNTGDLAHAVLAFGGISGVAGDGGSITRFRQPVSVQAAVDLIAGNGGSTLSYGTALSNSTNVGRGGTVDNVVVAGTIGAADRDRTLNYNPPIKSYLDVNGDGSETGTGDFSDLKTFLSARFGGTVDTSQLPGPRTFVPNASAVDPNTFTTIPLDNLLGNVGIVAGVAGRVKNGQPARDGINGNATSITASSIMSIVAGSVDLVAPVNTVSGLTATNIGGVLGADKSLPVTGPLLGGPNGLVEYFDANGNIVNNLQPGYRLLDGAIFASNIVQPATGPQLNGPRIFSSGGGGS